MNDQLQRFVLEAKEQRHGADADAGLKKAFAAREALSKMLKDIRPLKDLMIDWLDEKLDELKPGIRAERIFINRGEFSHDIDNRPTGWLKDVFFECLTFRISPNYVVGIDGLYDRPLTNEAQYEIAGLGIIQLEKLIEDCRRQFDWRLATSLDQYWKTPGNVQAPNFIRRLALQEMLNRTILAELALSVFAGRIDADMAVRVADALGTENGARYKVKFEYGAPTIGSFVVNSSGMVFSEIPLNDDNYGYVLYTSGLGFEYFPNSAEMHSELCGRYALPASSIYFPLLYDNVFEFVTDARLKNQKDEIRRLLNTNEMRGGPLYFSLLCHYEMFQLESELDRSLESLRESISRTKWPAWLKFAGADVQAQYVELENSMLKYDVDFKRNFGPYFSLKEYSRREVADWSRNALGVAVDADTIRVRTTYDLKVGAKIIRQEDSRTLSEFVAFGLHDAEYPLELSLIGGEHSGLTVGQLQAWMQTTDIRKGFVETRSFNIPASYHEALSNKFISKLRFDLWAEHHSGELDRTDFEQVSRAMDGDPSIAISAVGYPQASQPLRDVLVFQGPQKNHGPQQVYLRTPSGRHQFLRFHRFSDFAEQLVGWMIADPAYATSLAYPDDVPKVLEALNQQRERWPLTPVALERQPHNPLAGAVNIDYRCSLAIVNSIAPKPYRQATIAMRRKHARLTTELKALHAVGTRETGLPSYEVFSRELIKKRVEELMRSRGRVVEVDPDKVYIQLTPGASLSLSELIIQERSFEAPASPRPDSRDYPRFHWATSHPALDALMIRDIASWSKTLRSGEKYIEYLKQNFTSESAEFTFKRGVHFMRQLCEMSQSLLAQYFVEKLNSEQFNSLERIIDTLKKPESPTFGDPVVKTESVYQLVLSDNRRVDGVLLFRAVTRNGVEDFIYTPNAPDDLAFRSLDDFVWSIRNRFDQRLRDYLIQRVPFKDRKDVNNYFDEIFATVGPVSIQPRVNARVRDLRTTFEAYIGQLISDVDAQTTSLGEIIGRLVYDNVKLALTMISVVIPSVGVAVTAMETAKSIYDGLYALRYGEHDESFTHFKDVVLGLVSLGQGGKGVASVTKAQKSLIGLLGDANTVVALIGTVTDQQLGKERLLEVIQQVLDEKEAGSSRTVVI